MDNRRERRRQWYNAKEESKQKSTIIHTQLDPKTHTELKIKCAKIGNTMQDVVQRLIKMYVWMKTDEEMEESGFTM